MNLRESLSANQNASALNSRGSTQMLEGLVVSGSWTPTTNTVQAVIGDTVPYENSNFNGGINRPLIVVCTVCSPAPYDQGGPVGGERVQCWEAQGGWFCWFEAGEDDTPGAPAGERWMLHRSANSPNAVVFDAGIKLTNDGPTTGDKLGGTRIGNVGALTECVTSGGWVFTLDDTHALGTLTAPDGTIVQIDSNAGKVYLGANGLGSSNAVMTANDVQNALNALVSTLHTWANANFQSGTNTALAPTAPTASGSTTVFSKE